MNLKELLYIFERKICFNKNKEKIKTREKLEKINLGTLRIAQGERERNK